MMYAVCEGRRNAMHDALYFVRVIRAVSSEQDTIYTGKRQEGVFSNLRIANRLEHFQFPFSVSTILDIFGSFGKREYFRKKKKSTEMTCCMLYDDTSFVLQTLKGSTPVIHFARPSQQITKI